MNNKLAEERNNIPTDSREIHFRGTAEINAQVLETSFPENNLLILKVINISFYTPDKISEEYVVEGDEITIRLIGDLKSQTVCELINSSENHENSS